MDIASVGRGKHAAVENNAEASCQPPVTLWANVPPALKYAAVLLLADWMDPLFMIVAPAGVSEMPSPAVEVTETIIRHRPDGRVIALDTVATSADCRGRLDQKDGGGGKGLQSHRGEAGANDSLGRRFRWYKEQAERDEKAEGMADQTASQAKVCEPLRGIEGGKKSPAPRPARPKLR
ncbi:MAG: hypothetical protein WDM96_10565 [Lacunisphaera sp.]